MADLYLIPTPIYDGGVRDISMAAAESLVAIHHFIVEDLRSARRALRLMGYKANFDTEVQFYLIPKHDERPDDSIVRDWMKSKVNIGILSEAGLPCIADPGHRYVALGHTEHYRICPLSGPSSIFMALMASGFAGQNFAFNGYLPIDKSERQTKIKQLESRLLSESQTQLFMEAPYRNLSLLEDILRSCQSTTRLSIASNLSHPEALIINQSIADWRQTKPLPDIHKVPTIFALGIYST